MIYPKMHVLLLACVFQKFWQQNLEQDVIDPVRFVSFPGLGFMPAFKMTWEKIDILTMIDIQVHTFCEHDICSGMTFINKLLVRNEDINIDKQWITHVRYVDENNLHD